MAPFLLYRAGGMRGAIEFGRSPALAWAPCQDSFVLSVCFQTILSVFKRQNSLPGPQRISPALKTLSFPGYLEGPKFCPKNDGANVSVLCFGFTLIIKTSVLLKEN